MPSVIEARYGFRGPYAIDEPTIRQLFSLLQSIATDLDEIKTKYAAHKHSFDGSGTTSQITNTPVTGTTSGTATAGTASAMTITVTA